MSGNDAKTERFGRIERKQELAVAALLTETSIEAAAKKCGIGESTLFRWLQQPAFNAAYQEARGQVLTQAVAQLHTATTQAVATLELALTDAEWPARIRAAVAILDQAFKGREALDLSRRLTEIEGALRVQRADVIVCGEEEV